MAFLNATITGFNELRGRLNKAVKELPAEVDAEFAIAAENMRGGAIKDAPADQGTLRAEIQKQRLKPLNWGVFSNANYSGYVEFGTKSRVSIPAGLEAIASQFRGGGNTSSLEAKEAIYAWCKRKGIEKEMWWPIFIRIMVNGIRPHPYFFKQLQAVKPELLKNLENILKKI